MKKGGVIAIGAIGIAVLVLFGFSIFASAALTLDASSSTSGAAVSSLTWSHTVGSGDERILIVGVSLRKNSQSVSNITYGGVGGFTLIGSQLDGGADHRAELWYKLMPAVGTANVVVTIAGGTVDAVGGAVSFFNVDQTTPLGTFVGATNTSTTPSVTVTSATGEIVVDVMSSNGDSGTVSVGAGQTQQWNLKSGTGDGNEAGSGSTESGASSVTMSWTLAASNKWAIGAVSIKPDATAPAAVSNLTASGPTSSTINLNWTAPGDNGSSGTATTYDIRYSTSTITDGNFGSATQVTGEPSPSVAGSAESMTVTGLSPSTTYYFAMKTSDEGPNTSAISNVTSATTSAAADTTAPGAVSNLTASNPSTSTIDLDWTAPGDDGSSGTATTYDIRYSTSTVTDGNFSSATQVTGEPSPSVAGSAESMTVTGLSSGTTYYFAMKTLDEVPNTSNLSNVTNATTGTTPTPTPSPTGSPTATPTPSASASPTVAPPSDTSGGGTGTPLDVTFSGIAYPNSEVEVLRRTEQDTQFISHIRVRAGVGGAFVIPLIELPLRAYYLFAIRAWDTLGIGSNQLFFDQLVGGSHTFSNIIIPPTVIVQRTGTAGEVIKVSGYAGGEDEIQLELDGKPWQTVAADSVGRWQYTADVSTFAFGTHQIRAKRTGSDGKSSTYTSSYSFKIGAAEDTRIDLNGDHLVTISDWSIFLFRWGSSDASLRSTIDMDGDGIVNLTDFSIFLRAMRIS